MEEMEVILFLAIQRPKAKAIQAKLKSLYGPDACHLTTVKMWRTRFLQGRTALLDDPMSGKPFTHDRTKSTRPGLAETPFSLCKLLCGPLTVQKRSV
jgi:hypothetical protein